MENEICLRCNLPIRSSLGCICTAPNWRIFSSNEVEYLKDSTPELPMQWLTTFMERRELYRFRGVFFAPALNTESSNLDIIAIDELNHTYDIKDKYNIESVDLSPRQHYSVFLSSKIRREVKKSISMMNNNLSIVDKESGKHILHRYLGFYQDIVQNIRRLERPNPFSDAVIEELTKLKEYLMREEEYYFQETEWDETSPIDYYNMPIKQIVKRIFYRITEAQADILTLRLEGAASTQEKIDPIYFVGKLSVLMSHIKKLRESGRLIRKNYAPAISENCLRKTDRFSDAMPISKSYLEKH